MSPSSRSKFTGEERRVVENVTSTEEASPPRLGAQVLEEANTTC